MLKRITLDSSFSVFRRNYEFRFGQRGGPILYFGWGEELHATATLSVGFIIPVVLLSKINARESTLDNSFSNIMFQKEL